MFVSFSGYIHLVSSIGGAEHTLCGVANDAFASEDQPELEWKKTDKRVVDCEDCGIQIIGCRGIRVAAVRKGSDATR